MALSMVEIAFIIILVMLVGASLITFVYAYRYQRSILQDVTTRGMNGRAGTTLNLTCPAGEVISFKNSNPTVTRGAIICSGDARCDPFFQQGIGQSEHFFSQDNTIDVFADNRFSELKQCEGKNACNWTIPLSSDNRLANTCLGSCSGNIEFVGTYDCVPQN